MKIPGYCTCCRRFRQVTVTGRSFATYPATKVVEGLCAECEEKEKPKR